ncbi:MAG: thioredoxin family protein [Actinomycetota bacterium]|jgi:glutaredoxin|nr:thioredoxin family protein [Actinomycetota bacterium]
MNIKLFVKTDCPRCSAAKRACAGLSDVETYNVDDIDGLAEASFYGIMATPTVLVIDSEGNEVAGWRGGAPEPAALKNLITN